MEPETPPAPSNDGTGDAVKAAEYGVQILHENGSCGWRSVAFEVGARDAMEGTCWS